MKTTTTTVDYGHGAQTTVTFTVEINGKTYNKGITDGKYVMYSGRSEKKFFTLSSSGKMAKLIDAEILKHS